MSVRLLHVSDFHFVEKLKPTGFIQRLKPGGIRLKPGRKPHSFEKVQALSVMVQSLEHERGSFNVLLATGDLSTDGSVGAFATARSYLENSFVRTTQEDERVEVEGLGGRTKVALSLPGNHDRFGRSPIPFQYATRRFESAFGIRQKYPFVAAYTDSTPNLLFFVFDSTPSSTARMARWNRIARGRLEEAECRWLSRIKRDILSDGWVRDLRGGWTRVNFNNCVRIAVLHHHPLAARRLSLMENSALFNKHCFECGMHLVLFGHEHEEYHDFRISPGEGGIPQGRYVWYFCAPSATEYSSDSGFYAFTFHEKHFEFALYKLKSFAFELETMASSRYSQ